MEILEKFSFCRKIMGQYAGSRFRIMRYLTFAILLVILGQTELYMGVHLAWQFIYVFLTLFVFRMMDDAASFYIDRQDHPSRIYVSEGRLQYFICLGSILMAIYLASIFFFSVKLAWTMLILVAGSVILYLFFYRNRHVMPVIPLLKYPVIIWCISGFSWSLELGLIMAAAFLMMLSIDLFRTDRHSWKIKILKIIFLSVTGLLIIQPWHEPGSLAPDMALAMMPAVLVLFMPIRKYAYFPVILFPLLHLLDLLII